MPSVADWLGRFGQRLGRSTVLIAGGVVALLAVRELPPDGSLGQVREDGVLSVCVPRSLPPLLEPVEGDDGFRGREAEHVRAVAQALDVRIHWNIQSGWGDGIDPAGWGMRPSSCYIAVGGIIATRETRALMELVPYAETGWAFAGDPEAAETAGLYLPFWGVERGKGARFLRDEGYTVRFFFAADEARTALQTGEVDTILSLAPAARWLATEDDTVYSADDLPRETLAIGTWKGRTTINRAVRQAVRQRAAGGG